MGENINKLEQTASEYIGVEHAVALFCGTAALHLAVKLAAEQFYRSSSGISTPQGMGKGGCLYGKTGILLDENYMCEMMRSDMKYLYRSGHGRTCPMEIYDALAAFHIENRPICSLYIKIMNL